MDKAIEAAIAAFNKETTILHETRSFTEFSIEHGIRSAIKAYEAAKVEITRQHLEDFYKSGGKTLPQTSGGDDDI